MKKSFGKVVCIVLCVLMCTGMMSAFTASAEEYDFSYLQNTYSKIMAGETVNIAYYGGSVTNGYAGNGQDCQSNGKAWRSRTFKWFKDTFADTGATFVENHAAMGGTGTNMNIYRADEHLYLGTDKAPDLIFIEFAINDSYEGLTYEQSAEYMEAIIRKLYGYDPYIDIVIVLTTDNGKKDTEFTNAKAHADVAAKYDIPCVWVGAQIYRFLRELNGGNDITNVNGEPWSTYFADGCHPNAEGHAKYTEYILNDILVPNLTAEGLNLDASKRVAKVMPEDTPIYNNGRYVDSYGITAGKVSNFVSYSFGSNGTNIYGNTPGASFSVTFYGTGFGIMYTGSPSNGIVLYNVDGGSYSAKNLYTSGTGHEHTMLVDGLPEGEHTFNLILRKSPTGDYLCIEKFLVDGDTDKTPFVFNTAPTNAPNNDVYIADITLAPAELNTVISGGGYTNTGATMVVEESIVDDVDTIKYVPNTQSSDTIASDCYNSKLKSVSIPDYRYVTIGYHYKVEEGITPSATGMEINFLRNPGTNTSFLAKNANKLLVNKSDELIFDITGMAAEGVSGNLVQFHFRPFGNVVASSAKDGEVMYIKYMTFHANYPYNDSPVSLDLSTLSTEGGVFESKTFDGNNVLSVTANGGTAKISATGLETLELLPSVYKYAMVEYYAEGAESVKPVLRVPTLDNGAYEATAATLSNGEWKKAIFNLSPISDVNGQKSFYKDIELMPFGGASATSGTVNIKSVAFYSIYPDANAQFEVSFDINGGKGAAPASIKANLGSKVALPSCSATKEGYVFAGWSDTPDGDILKSFYMPENGAELYAVWKEQQTVYVSADSATIDYKGESHTVGYTSLSAALTALGTNGGNIVMTGSQTFTDINSTASGCLGIKIIGADSTATLTGFNSNINLKADTAFENIKITATSSTSYPHFFAQGHKLTIGEGCSFYYVDGSVNETIKRMEIVAGGGSTDSVDVVLSSWTYGSISTTYNQAFNGTAYYTVNGGTLQIPIDVGIRSNSSNVAKGSSVVTVNGGTFNAGVVKYSGFDVKGDESRTGAHTVIFNNDTYLSSYDLSKTDYIIAASTGGSVTATDPGSADTAPTFKLRAIGNYDIYVDEVLAGRGEYTYTPDTAALHTVRFDVPVFTAVFDENGGTGTVPSAVKSLEGTSIDLSVTGSLTKDGYTFIGWNTNPDAILPMTECTMPVGGTTLYAVWVGSDSVFVNPDGSGKLTVGCHEFDAVTSILDAASSVGTSGGVIYFTGTVDNGASNELFANLKTVTGGKVILQGVGNSAVLTINNTQVHYYCDLEFRNLTFDGANKDWFAYANGHNIVIGEKGVENDVRVADYGKPSNDNIRLIGGNSGSWSITANSGVFHAKVTGARYNADMTCNTLITLNGGTWKSSVNAGFLVFGTATYTQTGNSTIIVNGGTYETPKIEWKNTASVTGKKTVIFNNNTFFDNGFEAPDANYVIFAEKGAEITELVSGTSFLIEPESSYLIPCVNGTPMTKDSEGRYVLTPTVDGEYDITYNTIPTKTVSFSANGGSGTVPSSITGEVGIEIALPSGAALAKSGYTFLGWAETPDADVTLASFSIKPEDTVLYAIWRENGTEFFVNPDGSGKITVDGREYPAYSTILEAANAMTSAGGRIRFTGTVGNGANNELFNTLAKVTSGKVIIEGIGDDAEFTTECLSVDFNCDLEFRNFTLTMSVGDWFGYSNGHKIVFGEYGKENDIRLPSSQYIRLFGGRRTTTDITVNSGYFVDKFSLANYAASLTGDTLLTINGGTWQNGVNAGFYNFGAASYTQTGNSTVIINGGTFINPTVVWKYTGSVTGKKTVIFNNNTFADKGFTSPDANYVIKSATGGEVSVKTVGTSFKITPNEGYIPYVNGSALDMSESGEYILTPTSDGTYEITYEAEQNDITVTFSISLERDSAYSYYDIEGYNNAASIVIKDSLGNEVYNASESGVTAVSDEYGKAVLTFTAALPESEYILNVTKNGYVSQSMPFTVSVDSVNVAAILVGGDIKGSFDDVCGDGTVDIDDFIRLIRSFDPASSSLLRAVTDINEDRATTIEDLAIIKISFGK